MNRWRSHHRTAIGHLLAYRRRIVTELPLAIHREWRHHLHRLVVPLLDVALTPNATVVQTLVSPILAAGTGRAGRHIHVLDWRIITTAVWLTTDPTAAVPDQMVATAVTTIAGWFGR